MANHFRKWRHIENLDDFLAGEELKRFPADCRYVITEKLDGSNLHVAWDSREEAFSFFTRNGNDPFESVRGFREFAGTLGDLADLCRELAGTHPEAAVVGFYGELIGNGIMNRLNYCVKPELRLFHLYYENAEGEADHRPFPELVAVLEKSGLLPRYGMPVLGETTLGALVGWRAPEYRSVYPTAKGFEGVVFHPVEEGSWNRTIFKWKTPQFSEVMSRKGGKVTIEKDPEEARIIGEGRALFSAYINENRAYGILSKFGSIRTKDIGKATAAFISDAREDFLKDHPEFVGHEHLKEILNVGSAGFLLIRRIAYEQAEAEKTEDGSRS